MAQSNRIGQTCKNHLVAWFWVILLLLALTFGVAALLSSDLRVDRVAEPLSSDAQKR